MKQVLANWLIAIACAFAMLAAGPVLDGAAIPAMVK